MKTEERVLTVGFIETLKNEKSEKTILAIKILVRNDYPEKIRIFVKDGYYDITTPNPTEEVDGKEKIKAALKEIVAEFFETHL